MPVYVKRIWMERAEGPTAECGEVVFEGREAWDHANAILRSWQRTAPSRCCGYNKIDVEVEWANGERYAIRYDLDSETIVDLGTEVRRAVRFYAGLWRPRYMTANQHQRVLDDCVQPERREWYRRLAEAHDFDDEVPQGMFVPVTETPA